MAPVLLIPLFALKCHCFARAGWSLEESEDPLYLFMTFFQGLSLWILCGDPERCVIMMIT